jgi:DNA replication and repair protein RecF
MHLQSLHLLNFKNYPDLRLDLAPGINAIVGRNGSGKTNLLDAIYYLCTTKSAFHATDAYTPRFGELFFLTEGVFALPEETFTVQLSVHPERGKVLKVNRQEYERLGQHIGRFPCVLLTPYDTDLIREGGEVRRKFFDGALALADPPYLDQLLRFNHLLKQRNGLLRQFAERGPFDAKMVEVYDEQLLPLMGALGQKRADYLAQFTPVFERHYAYLADAPEPVAVAHLTETLAPDFAARFRANLPRDLAAQLTTLGPHKDDYAFTINGHLVKKIGSQGQQKSFVVALKLAQFDFLAQQKAARPLLLLDDIFDKLDDRRIARLMQLMHEGHFGQVFVTDARPERTRQIFAERQLPVHVVQVGVD